MNVKWYNEYINNIDISQIEWVKFDKEQFKKFYDQNYFDKDTWRYVKSESDSSFTTPLGLVYLNFEQNRDDYSFLLGLVNNNIQKKTIVAAMVYLENYYVFKDQKNPLTYISAIETNLYFRNKGIYKKLCQEVINFINSNQHILVSRESDMGRKYGVVKKLKEILIKKGFEKTIWIDDYSNYMNREFYETITAKQKVLK